MKKLLVLFTLLGAALVWFAEDVRRQTAPPATAIENFSADDQRLEAAFANHLRNFAVHGQGVVTRVLPDDTNGIAHQRFILRLGSGQTLLIAHNISVAPRIDSLKEGDTVEFLGVYEWKSEGGVIHWTHRDLKGGHSPGWLKHNGRTYQ
ncbi:MAG: DUF3465 domain-containing protein [Chthoniobacteraceae bacterium]